MTLILLLLAACTTDPPPVESDAAPETAPASATPAAPDEPRAKAFTEVAQPQLGTLPEGIGIPVGKPAPDATVTDDEGNAVQLASLYAEGPVLVVFYRGGWCPFCNFQVRELVEGRKRFAELGVTPVLISVDQPSAASRTRDAWHIPYPVLSDPDLAAHRAFAVTQVVDDGVVADLAARGFDLEAASGREHHTIAVPSVFLVEEGTVRWAHADPEYKVRPTNAQLFEAIRQAREGA